MKQGNWIPMDKSLVNALPRKRPYTLIEAAFSYQLDLDNGITRGFREYARIWRWSTNKVIGFIRDKQGTRTDQPKDTHGTVKFRWVKPLEGNKGQAEDKHGTSRRQARDTTIILNPDKKNICDSKSPSSSLQEKTKRIPSNGKDPRVRQLIDSFSILCKEELDQEPVIQGAKDGSAIKRTLARLSEDQIKNVFDWYIKSPKARNNGLSIAVALSNHSLSEYQKKRKWLDE